LARRGNSGVHRGTGQPNDCNNWAHPAQRQTGEARHFFWQALLSSPVVEQITETEDMGGGKARYYTHEFRKAHAFLLEALAVPDSREALNRTFQLLLACRSGAPYALSETILRYSPAGSTLESGPGTRELAL
jgi:hypothetical protein